MNKRNDDVWEVLIMGNVDEATVIAKQVKDAMDAHEISVMTHDDFDTIYMDLQDNFVDCEIEISVAHKNNKHGHESYGWGDTDKIILWGSGQNDFAIEEFSWCKKIAKLLCDQLNKLEVRGGKT